MRDKPIKGRLDKRYSIKYDQEANNDYKNYFDENTDDVIFINGKWGSGKTSYLNVVLEENCVERYYFKDKKKIIKTIDLWRISSNQSTAEICYRKIFPFTGIILRYAFLLLFLICYVIAGFKAKPDLTAVSKYVILFFTVSGLLSGVTQIMGKVNYESVFLMALKWRTKRLFLWKKRIIIIDDFDRVEPERQNQLYKIFNLITSPSVQFVFLGDYTKIQKNKDGYLQKIVDRRIELPYILSPLYFWVEYFDSLVSKIEEKRKTNLSGYERKYLDYLQKEIIMESRTLREKIIFEKYVEEVLFNDNRYDKINLDQQLVTIYLYLFQTSYYNKLVANVEILLEPFGADAGTWGFLNDETKKEAKLNEIKKKAIQIFSDKETSTTKLILNTLLCYDTLVSNQNNTDYLYGNFTQFFPNYFVNYVPLNIGGQLIRDMVEKPYNRLESLSLLEEKAEVFNYLRRNQNRLKENEKKNLFNLAIDFVFHQDDQYPYNPTSDHGSELKKEINLIIHLAMHVNTVFLDQMIKDNSMISGLDVSAQLRFYDEYGKRGLPNITDAQNKEILSVIKKNAIKEQSYPEYIFHYLISLNSSLAHYGVEVLITLEDPQFFYFLVRYSITGLDAMVVDLKNITQCEELEEKVEGRYNLLPEKYKENLKIRKHQ